MRKYFVIYRVMIVECHFNWDVMIFDTYFFVQ